MVLNATVNPKGAETMYFFQYGTTVIYGAQTPSTSAGKGTAGVKVAAAVADLAPATTYHYRIVAQNAKGLTRGKDRTFKTKRQPLGVSLAATPNPVSAGGATSLAGALTGTGNAARQVQLQANPWPYSGFLAAGNAQVTGPAGEFAFPVLGVSVNTQYRVLLASKPNVVSPVVVVGTTVKVTRKVRVDRGARSARIRFRGRRDAGGRRPAGADPATPQGHLGQPRPDHGPPRRDRLLALQQADPRPPRRPVPRRRGRHPGRLTERRAAASRAPRARLRPVRGRGQTPVRAPYEGSDPR